MKETKETPIAVEELVVEGVYKTHANNLVQIKAINKHINQLHIYDITESCNVYTDLERHMLVKRIR